MCDDNRGPGVQHNGVRGNLSVSFFLFLLLALAPEGTGKPEDTLEYQRARADFWEAMTRQLVAVRDGLAQELKSRAEVQAQEPQRLKALENMRKICDGKFDDQAMRCKADKP